MTMTDADATAEIGWIAREARALIEESVPEDSDRWRGYMERKRALLAYVESARGSVTA